MASVFDVARYILEKQGKMSTMKLQKLCYYSQAWSLVWDDQPLFDEEFRAWANGPVCRELFRETQGQFAAVAADEKKGDSGRLTANQKIPSTRCWSITRLMMRNGSAALLILRILGSRLGSGCRLALAVTGLLPRKAWRFIMAGSKKQVRQRQSPSPDAPSIRQDPNSYYSRTPSWNFNICDTVNWAFTRETVGDVI